MAMRIFLFALAVLTAFATSADAEDYSVLRAHFLKVAFVGHPDDGEVRIGADLEGTLRVTAVLYGSFDLKKFDIEMNVRDGRPLHDLFLLVGRDGGGHPFVDAYSPAKYGFCLDVKPESRIPADAIARLRRRYPCTNLDW
jgi:hypothetical protein